MPQIERTRMAIALLVIVGFFVLVTVVLMGFVDITSPEIAKLVGLLVGYIVALMNPIIMRYFETSIPPAKEE
jgi:hypothetical protein